MSAVAEKKSYTQKQSFALVIVVVLVFIGICVYFSQQTNLPKNNQFPQPREKALDEATVIKKAKADHTTFMYTVQSGDTLDSLSKKFDISTATITQSNSLRANTVTPGQVLIILPVNGALHKVVPGDTLDSLAAQYHTDKQKILSYPFNKFRDSTTQPLIIGEMLIIPDAGL